MSYFPFPIFPTSHPHIDLLINTLFGIYLDSLYTMEYLDRNNYKSHITRPTFNYDDLNYEGQTTMITQDIVYEIAAIDHCFKLVRSLMALLETINNPPNVSTFGDYMLLEIFKEIKRDIKDPDHVFDLQIMSPVSLTYDFNEELNELIFSEKEKRRLEEENRRIQEEHRRLEAEKRRSVRNFLKIIQNRIETIRQEEINFLKIEYERICEKEILLEEMRKEKFKFIKKQEIIKKQMKEYCFPNDDDLY